MVSAHLGVPAHGLPVIAEGPGHRYVDVDIALERIAGRDPEARLAGIGGGDARYHMDLADESTRDPRMAAVPPRPGRLRQCRHRS